MRPVSDIEFSKAPAQDLLKWSHTIENAISCLKSAFFTLTDCPEHRALAFEIFEDSLDELLMLRNDVCHNLSEDSKDVASGIERLGFDAIKEKIYGTSHPEIRQWTQFFKNRYRKLGIFENFERDHPERSSSKAVIVGVSWLQFSEFMPLLLCQAAAKVSSNLKRHYVIQTAYEELGMRSVDQIHAQIFWAAAEMAGAGEEDKKRLLASGLLDSCLHSLEKTLLGYEDDEHILGLLLGMEAPAVENIETLFRSLAHSSEVEATLDESEFFVLHRRHEPEHIRLAVSNFLRFCQDETSRARFIAGFDDGIQFWQSLWKKMSGLIQSQCEGHR
jgi:hypothetical protein